MGVAFTPHNPVAAINIAAISASLQSERRERNAQQMHRDMRKIVALMEAATPANMAASLAASGTT